MADSEQPESLDVASELETLRAENAALREQMSGAQTPQRPPGHRRRWASITCAVVGAILLPISVATVWANTTMLDTDEYVATVAPLAEDEDIQEAVSFRVTEAVAEAVDFGALAEELLPPEAAILAAPIESGAKGLIQDVVDALVSTDVFADLWEEANRVGHQNLVLVLTGEGNESVSTENGQVVLGLGPLAEETIKRLDELLGTDLAEAIPAEQLDAEFVLVESDDLASLQDQIRWFDALSWISLILAVVLLVAAVLFAEQRRLGFRRLGLAMVVPTALTLVLYAWARGQYLDGLSADVHNPDAAAAVFDITTRFLQRTLRALLVLGVIVLLGAWVVGPSASAAKVRSWWDALLGRAGDSSADREVGSAPRWVAAHQRTLLIGAIVLGGLALLVWSHPTGLTVILVVVVTLLVMGGIRLVGEVGRRAEAETLADAAALEASILPVIETDTELTSAGDQSPN